VKFMKYIMIYDKKNDCPLIYAKCEGNDLIMDDEGNVKAYVSIPEDIRTLIYNNTINGRKDCGE